VSLVISKGRLIDPANSVDKVQDIFIHDGFIVALGKAPGWFEEQERLDVKGCIVCPGLIDLRARLREPGLEHKATMASETLAAARAGITTLCVPPDTNPVVDTPAMVQMIQQRAWQLGKTFVHPMGALTTGLKGETLSDMGSLADAGCVGVSNGVQSIESTLIMRRAMQYAATFELTVFLYPHDPWLRGNGVVHEGAVSTRLGLPAVPLAAEVVGVARDLALVETTGARSHFCNLSSARAVEMIADARERGLPVTADVAAHYLHLTDQDVEGFDTNYHVQPPLRSDSDRDALRHAIANGTVQAICSDHQPHETEAKLTPFSESEPGISALETLLPLTLDLVNEGHINLVTAIASLTSNPASILGIEAGQLSVGATADLCVIDPNTEWTLQSDDIRSMGRNTPFIGRNFKGRIERVFIGGNEITTSGES
jgi:dihydroorotase